MFDELDATVGDLRGEDVELHSLPPFDTYKFISEHSTAFAVTVAIASVAVTVILWRFVRAREEEQFDFTRPQEVRRGKFNASIMNNLRRTPQTRAFTSSHCTDRSQLTNDGGDRSDSSDESTEMENLPRPIKREEDSLEEIRAIGGRDLKLKRSNQTDSDDELEDRIEEVDEGAEENGGVSSGNTSRKGSAGESGNIDLVATLGKLHGKLATAELRARASRMEKEMTEEQRNEAKFFVGSGCDAAMRVKEPRFKERPSAHDHLNVAVRMGKSRQYLRANAPRVLLTIVILKEREIRNKQLEAIYAMMMTDTEKFGMQDKSEIMEQMKLYSI
ncbi:unnamed protein product [Toxocara canis]|uniref:RPAP1_N domain-containing protein n=1 Tax=Toxocara canis TaxID=6265 RepID=A0A183V1S7_TOXCA|nr:unnamed protein product [Toxocara canis]